MTKSNKSKLFVILNSNSRIKNSILSCMFISIGVFLFYGSYITYSSTKVISNMSFSKITQHIESRKGKSNKCLSFYKDFNRGGFMLERFLQQYSAYVVSLDIDELEESALKVLYETQCKANNIIKSGHFRSSLLNISMQVDTRFFYKFGATKEGDRYFENHYEQWFNKALIMADTMPNRGDLVLPFLSYAINNNRSEDAVKVCSKALKGIEAMCDLIFAYKILSDNNVNNKEVTKSINLIKNAIDKGIFNEMTHGYLYAYERENDEIIYAFWGLRGIPLSPDLLFLVSEEEKFQLEGLIGAKN